jgi:hypothetical protein
MRGHLMSETYRSTVFTGKNLPEILVDVVLWLRMITPTGKFHDFYFVDMTYSYDGENGISITVWHGELE